MGKATFPETTGQESSKPQTSGSDSSSDMRNALSSLFQGDLAPLRARAKSTPNMTVAVNPAAVGSFYSQVWLSSTSPLTFAGGNSPSVSAPSSNPRIDLLTIDSSGTLAWTTGSEGASPSAPSCPTSKLPICYVYCKTTMTKIVNYEDKDANSTEGYIYMDLRPLLMLGDQLVINTLTEKTAPVAGDLIVVEDSEASNTRKKVKIGTVSGLAGPAQSSAKAYRSSSVQTIGTGAWTKVQLNAEEFDVGNEFDYSTNYRFTATKAGKYLIIGKVLYNDGVADKSYYAGLYKNGALIDNNRTDVPIAGGGAPAVSAIVNLAANDYIELYTYHNAGTDEPIANNQHNTALEIVRMTP